MFEATDSRRRVVFIFLLTTIIAVVGVYLIVRNGREGRETLIGWELAILAGLVALFALSRVFQTGPSIRVDEQGIWWRHQSRDIIPWSAFAQIRQGRRYGRRYACLYLDDNSAYRADHQRSLLQAINRSADLGDVPLSAMGTNRSFDDLWAAIRRFAPPGVVA